MSESNKPNILFLMTDQQRNDTFSCINPEVVTPHMDQLIADSVFFSNARCANPSCVPSRAAIMTGKFPSECECPTFITHLPAHETTFMSRLQEAGYHTAVIGKQHFAGSPIKRGYDEEMIIDGHSALYPDDTIQPYLDYLTENGIDRKHVMSKTLISGGTWEVDTKYHLDDYIGELGKAWMKKKGAAKDECDKPWFLTLSFSGPHHPYDCEGTEFAELYDYEKLSVPKTSYADLDEKPPHFKQMGSYADIYLKHFSEETFKKTKRSYYANISLIDQKVGELIRIMKENHLYDNTLIIYLNFESPSLQ